MDMECIEIGYLGYGTRALDALMEDERFHVRYFFTPSKNLCRDVEEAKKRYPGLIYREISGKKELAEAFGNCADVSCFLMNACSIILNEEILSKMGVYNIHPGSLAYNRGHHPHLWTVRLMEEETEITLHKVTPSIDLGEVIACEKIRVSRDWDELQVLNAAEDRIPQLLHGLYRYLTGQQKALACIRDGGYRRVMQEEDYEIIWEEDTPEIVKAKILCRAAHRGAFFQWEGNRIYIDRILEESRESGAQRDIAVRTDGENREVFVSAGGERYRFRLNSMERIGK